MKIYLLACITLFLGTNYICRAQDSMISQEVKENIKLRVDNHMNAGVVIGVITPQGATYYSYGVKSLKTKEPVDENSVFEIGSISKTFTGILLAEMSLKGELKLDDPLQDFLPDGIIAPTRKGDSIKLFQLSNHTSSLPSLPDNLPRPLTSNPYANFSEKQLYDFLNDYELTRGIGSIYEYSNYAVGLLGHILASKRKVSYEQLMVDVIAKPLGMENTRVVFTPSMKENLAMGHNFDGTEAENWDLPTLAGAGGIRSTAVDMLKYLAVNMGMEKNDLYPAMQLAHKNSRSEESTPNVGLGWHTYKQHGVEIIWHNGGTGGYASYTGFIKDGDKGVVVLSNSSVGIDDIGIHILQPTATLKSPIPSKPSIQVEIMNIFETEGIEAATKTYWDLRKNQRDKYNFSEYELNDLGYGYLIRAQKIDKAIAIFKLNVEAFPNSYNVYDSYGEALLKSGDKEGAIENYSKSVELHPGNEGGIKILNDLGVETDQLIKEVIVEDAILKSYVGKYELAPGNIITVTKYDGQLKAQGTGNPEHPIFPISDKVFYYKVEQAQLTFNLNEDGVVESVTLLQTDRARIGRKLVE